MKRYKQFLLRLSTILFILSLLGCSVSEKTPVPDDSFQMRKKGVESSFAERESPMWYETLPEYYTYSSPINGVAPWLHLPNVYNLNYEKDLPIISSDEVLSSVNQSIKHRIYISEGLKNHSFVLDMSFFEPICFTENGETIYQHKELGNDFLVVVAPDELSVDVYFDFEQMWVETPLFFYFDAKPVPQDQEEMCTELLRTQLEQTNMEKNRIFEKRHTIVAALEDYPGISYQFYCAELVDGSIIVCY